MCVLPIQHLVLRHLLKRQVIVLLLLFLCGERASAQLLFKLTKDSLITFSYSGGDEFNGTALNTTAWKDSQWPSVNMAQEFVYTSRNVKLQQGVLHLAMTKRDSVYRVHPLEMDSNFLREKNLKLPDQRYLFHYEAGSIVSHQKFHYGMYALRFKIEEGKGVWPAFWFFGGYKNEEIDVFELKGERSDETHVDTHCPYGCGSGYKNKLGFKTSWGGWLPLSGSLHEGYHLAQLEWTAEGLTWYIDSYPLAWFKGNFANPMNIYINTQVAKDGRAFKPGPDASTPFPNLFYVDYLRIWKRDNSELPVLTPSDLKESTLAENRQDVKPTKKRGLMYVRSRFNTIGMVELVYSQERKLKVYVGGDLRASASLSIYRQDGKPVYDNINTEKEHELGPGIYELRLQAGKKAHVRTFKIN